MIKSPTQRENADRTNEHHEDIENAKLIIENFISKNADCLSSQDSFLREKYPLPDIVPPCENLSGVSLCNLYAFLCTTFTTSRLFYFFQSYPYDRRVTQYDTRNNYNPIIVTRLSQPFRLVCFLPSPKIKPNPKEQ